MRRSRGILRTGILRTGVLCSWSIIGLVGLAIGAEPARRPADQPPLLTSAERDVQTALAAELAGENPLRNKLLAQALMEDPNCSSAHWQAGMAQVDGKWLTPEQAQAKYGTDHNLAEYRRLRDQADKAGLLSRGQVLSTAAANDGSGGTTQAATVQSQRSDALSPEAMATHAALARWCHSKHLLDEERAHWLQVLQEDPNNAEAQASLKMHWFMGDLMTAAEIQAAKAHRAEELHALIDWKPTIARWQKQLSSKDSGEQAKASADMQKCADPGVIPALTAASFARPGKTEAARRAAAPFQREAVALLGRLSTQRATSALAQFSVLATSPAVRAAAAGELSKRKLPDFVPILLSGLANPIQFEYTFWFDPSEGVAVYRAAMEQEGQFSDDQVYVTDSVGGLLPASGVVSGYNEQKTVTKIAPSKSTKGTVTLDPRSREWAGQKVTGQVNTYNLPAGPGVAAGEAQLSRVEMNNGQLLYPSLVRVDKSYNYESAAWKAPSLTDWQDVPGAVAKQQQSQQLAAGINAKNRYIGQMNRRINLVLERVTGQSIGKIVNTPAPAADSTDDSGPIPDAALATTPAPETTIPDFWWNWWQSYTEAYAPPKSVNVVQYSDSSYMPPANVSNCPSPYGQQQPKPKPSSTYTVVYPKGWQSCFAAGTPVVTLTGPVPIEKLKIGDRVLSQDPDSGELAFKPVLLTTARPPADLLAISTAEGTIRATRGHPFWIEGKGWRMAKESRVGDILHELGGGAAVTAIASQPAEPAYNLIVADFHTYFVGAGRILVHDNASRLPTPALLPGYVAEGTTDGK